MISDGIVPLALHGRPRAIGQRGGCSPCSRASTWYWSGPRAGDDGDRIVHIASVHMTMPVRVYDPVLVIRHGSTCNPFTRLNSLWLPVATPAPKATAWPASKVS